MTQIDMNLDKKLVIVHGKYHGETISEVGVGIWKVKYIGKDGETCVHSFFEMDMKFK
jgi:hypothetical protein